MIRLLFARPVSVRGVVGTDRLDSCSDPGDRSADFHRNVGQRIPGMSIAIATRDGSIWSNGYGMADLENFVPAKASTVYRTASIAKPITAVAAMQLVESGALNLDAPIDTYVPSFPKKQWPITTRQLLGHLGGIRGYKDGAETYLTKHYWSLSEASMVFAEDPLLHEPGSKYFYSTFGYVLAGLAVEAAGKQSVRLLPADSYLCTGGNEQYNRR